MKKTILSTLACVFLLACGGNSELKQSESIVKDGSVTTINGVELCKINSGFSGDSQCILPPSADKGFQLHYGPANYDDPVELNKFTIAPSDELVDCMFMKTPNQDIVHVNEYHARLRPGTHHMITYVQPAVHADSTVPEACNQGPGFTFLVGATTVNTDISSSGQDNAPEYDGAALKIPAIAQVAVQLHYINTTDKPLLKEGWINVFYTDTVKLEVNPITWLGGLGMAVKPQTNEIITAGGSTCTTKQDASILMLVAHAHSHTVRVSSYIQRAGDTTRQLIYESYDWQNPAFINYNSVRKNTMPDLNNKVPGGVTGDLVAHPGDQLSWECDVRNNSNITLNFSDKALTGEMCNMFGIYAPSTGTPWSCYSL